MRLLVCCLLVLLALPRLSAGVDEDWRYILSLDAGPKKKPVTRDEVTLLARNHLLIQRKAIERFLARYPSGPHAFDAKLKLARVLAAEGKMAGDPSKVNDALRLLTELEKTPGVPRERLADAGFALASLSMQNQNENSDRMRESAVWSARNFTAKYPGDRRGPRLLVEAATVCDDVPNQKRDLLEEALRLSGEEPLRRRIADDLRRLDLLGKPLNLKATALGGGEIDLARLRGYVVVLIFWSVDSPHSLLWLRDFRSSWETLPKDQIRVVTISLDEDQKSLESRLRELHASWPTHFDGLGWHSPVARSLGINALPSVWILDKKGILRTINARSSYETWIRQLLAAVPS
ncbi:MAG TPA: TlpA disulfide reductase family protein [Terrimicrobiaceae bacterium]